MKHTLISLVLLASPLAAEDRSQRADRIEFFERKIRPVLVTHCYECHSASAAQANKLKGRLLLDSRQAIRQGGDSGPAVVPGQPADSLLISALRYEDFEMPPQGKLPAEVVADFIEWVRAGAADPRDGKAAVGTRVIDVEHGRQHWAYQQPRQPAPPVVSHRDWPHNTIDLFVLAQLERQGWLPAPDAAPETLVRRLFYDLIGLPPAPTVLDKFLSDPSPRAYQQLVERLLASPRFGERWGRHWLDVVRFGESNTLRGTVFSQAWRYRDWVIDSFNGDLSFDRFVLDQVAGDLLPADSWQQRRQQLTATALLALGNTNFENQDKQQLRMDVVDEQLETIGRAFLAQTIACARCHDHKFDPIPTRDYYALAGILKSTKTLEHANVSRWLEVPLPSNAETEARFRRHEAKLRQLRRRIASVRRALGADAPTPKEAKSVSLGQLDGLVLDDMQAARSGEWSKSTAVSRYVNASYLHDRNDDKGQKWVVFELQLPKTGLYEVRVSYAAGTNRASNTPVTIQAADRQTTMSIDQRVVPPIDGLFVSLGTHAFRRDRMARVTISNEGTDGHVIADAVQFLARHQIEAAVATSVEPTPQSAPTRVAQLQTELKQLESQLKQLERSAPARELAMSVLEESEIGDTQVHIRGNVHSLGESVPRGFLQVASYQQPPAFTDHESGRRQLGEWLASPQNPLTARVTVNRLWHWLFGAGLVNTTDNFGNVGGTPSHPELLDYLAIQFCRDNWSVKSMLRRMVLSHTYRTSSRLVQPRRNAESRPHSQDLDVENRLLWRMNRRRLQAECIRDTMLAVSGQLQLQMHGPEFPPHLKEDYDFQYRGLRRSVYAPVFRNALPEVFEVFDFADPSTVVGRRSTSIAAPQSLYLLNNPFVIQQCQQAARKLLAEMPFASVAARIERAYRLTLGRRPTLAERQLAMQYVAGDSDANRLPAWSDLFQALFASLDFRYLD